nr:MAG TPA: hypothetical protein [Caudoviricetes sp.]
MKSDYGFPDKGTIWFVVALVVIGAAFIIAVAIWADGMSRQSIENTNTEARCKSAGGEMGYSKCFKNGREI